MFWFVLSHRSALSHNESQLNHQRGVDAPARSSASTERSRMHELDHIATDAKEDISVAFQVNMANIVVLSFQRKSWGSRSRKAWNIKPDYSSVHLHYIRNILACSFQRIGMNMRGPEQPKSALKLRNRTIPLLFDKVDTTAISQSAYLRQSLMIWALW